MSMTSTTTRTTLTESVFKDVVPVQNAVRILRSKMTMIVKDDCVSLIQSEFITGLSSSGKVWYRWRDINCIYLSYRARGKGPLRLNMYRKESYKLSGKGIVTRFRNDTARTVSFYPFDSFPAVTDAIIDLLLRHNLISTAEADHYEDLDMNISRYLCLDYAQRMVSQSAFPILKTFSDRRTVVPSGLTLAARENTIQDFVRVAFGKKRYRKDLVKACANSNLIAISFAREYRQYVPVDWLIDILNTPRGQFRELLPNPYTKEVLKDVPIHRRRAFMLDSLSMSWWYIKDISDMITGYNLGHVISVSKNFTDLHDRLASEVRKLKTENREIIVSGYAEKFHNTVTASGLRILAPEETETIHTWGDRMHNCIGSYAARAVNGKVFIGGVYSDNGLIGNFEISENGKLRQLLGKYNEELTQDLQTDILDTLVNVEAIHIDKKTKDIGQVWGVQNYVPINEREMITQ